MLTKGEFSCPRCIGALASVPDVDRWDFGCAAWWWGAVPDVAFGGEARGGGRWGGAGGGALASVPDVDSRNLNDCGGLFGGM